MAVTRNTYTGNGSTTNYSFTFPYLETTDIKVSVNGTDTTAYTLANATTIQFNTAPANGAAIRIYRQTDDTALAAAFYPGSAIRSADLNDNFTQNLYVTQESNRDATQAISTANSATTTANTALSNSSTAISTANTAASNASAAVNTANTASSNASAAVSTANTASSNASSAVSTANTAATNASTALSTANQALSTANTASTNASAAVTTANSASSASSSATSTANTAASNAASAVSTANAANTAAGNAVTTANSAATDAAAALSASTTATTNAAAAVSTANTASTNASAAVSTANTAATNASTALSTANTALSTANTASTNASNAVTTANSASSTASGAVTTANSANAKADQAIAAVANSINFQLKSNVAAIPASPANDTYIEVQDSTGLESFTPLTGKPAGFVGDSGLSVRLRYTSAGSTWNWLNYYANNSETRYLKLAGGTLTGNLTLAGAPTSNLHPATKLYVDTLGATKLDTTTAASTYQTQAGMSSYLTTANASSTYLTQANAASTYQTQAGMSSYLTTANAASTYQTQAGMSSYLTTSAAGSTYAPLASPTFTGTPTGPSFSVTGSSVPTNGVYLPAANSVAISTNSTGRLFINSSGSVGIGASSPASILHVNQDVSSGNYQSRITLENTDQRTIIGSYWRAGIGQYSVIQATNEAEITPNALALNPSGGNVGIGTSTPQVTLDCNGNIRVPKDTFYQASDGAGGWVELIKADSSNNTAIKNNKNLAITFETGGSEAARFDGNRRLLVGTSSTSVNDRLIIQGNVGDPVNGGGPLSLCSAATTPGDGWALGFLNFADNTHASSASLIAARDGGTWSASSKPTRLTFSTCPDNSASPVERVRIASTGALGLSGANYGSAGQVLTSQGSGAAPQWATPSSGPWQFISSVTASNSASVAFTSGITSTYDVYMITGVGIVPTTDATVLNSRFSTNSGSSYITSGYDSFNANLGSMGAHTSDRMILTEGLGLSNNTSRVASMLLYLYRPSGSGYKTISSTVSFADRNNTPYHAVRIGSSNTTTAVNAIQFYMASGNISTGTFRLYGLNNS